MTQQVESQRGLPHPAVHAHSLPLPYASDEYLIALLDTYPAELFDINRYDFDEEGQVSLRTGERGRADGAAVLAAIKAGKLWVNLRSVEKAHPELWAAVAENFAKMASGIGAKGVLRKTGQLILSSPTTKVPYHFDAAGVVLFHMRGRKRIWIYPPIEMFLPQEAMEQSIMRTATEELPYMRRYDAAAKVFDLEPGQAVTWPLYAPHRVENLDSLCVSLSMDFQTWGSRVTNGAYVTNGVLRRWGWKIAPVEDIGGFAHAVRWAFSLVFKKAGWVRNGIKNIKREFDVAAPDVALAAVEAAPVVEAAEKKAA